MPEDIQTVRILGVDFFNDTLECALNIANESGGLILAPSGPGLATLGESPYYDEALSSADINLIDSGYLALLWERRTGQKLYRHSGLKFIKALIASKTFKAEHSQLWVMPNKNEAEAAYRFLNEESVAVEESQFYCAPYYSQPKVRDETLLASIRCNRPRYIILAIAGGKQEVLGHWLRDQLDYRPAIICIGAAIAFLSGHQANIPPWADRVYIGWLLRILQDPKTFLPRYWKARKLGKLVNANGEKAPV